MHSTVQWAALTAALVVSGCGLFADKISNSTTTAGSKPIQIDYDQVDLIRLLTSDGTVDDPSPPIKDADKLAGWRIDAAFKKYHADEISLTEDQKKARRDQVQERLLGASNQLCSRYRAYLQAVNNNGNFVFGSLATMAGAAGALLTGGASQALSGAAAVFSGERAEFNQDYFSNLTVAAIWSGIDARRHDVYDAIARNGQSKNVEVYPIEAAVKDAIYYHGECSLVAGVEKATDSIKQVDNPGLDMINKALFKASMTNAIVKQMATGKPVTPDMIQSETPTGVGTRAPNPDGVIAGTPLNNNGLPEVSLNDPLTSTAQLLAQANSIEGDAITQISKLKHLSATMRGDTQDAPINTVKLRTAAAITQLSSCHDTAATASSTLASADLAAQGAGTNDQPAMNHALESAQLNGASVVNQMTIAIDWLQTDLTSGLAKLTDLDTKADTAGGSTIADTDVKSANVLFTKNQAGKLACAK